MDDREVRIILRSYGGCIRDAHLCLNTIMKVGRVASIFDCDRDICFVFMCLPYVLSERLKVLV